MHTFCENSGKVRNSEYMSKNVDSEIGRNTWECIIDFGGWTSLNIVNNCKLVRIR